MNILVAGGAGYIGSHTVRQLQKAGHNPIVFDNGSRGHPLVADILDCEFVRGELDDKTLVAQTLEDHAIDVVMHFAAYAYVGESVTAPLMYYHNNVARP